MKARFLLAITLAAATVVITAQNPDRIYQLKDLKTANISVAGRRFTVWIMNTPAKRNEGMMFLKDKDVHIDQGMLFVFASPQPLSFWMRNTLIPLDIAYIDRTGKILNTPQMKALDETGVPSKGAAMYALEMKQGAFKKYGIKPGMKVTIPHTVKATS